MDKESERSDKVCRKCYFWQMTSNNQIMTLDKKPYKEVAELSEPEGRIYAPCAITRTYRSGKHECDAVDPLTGKVHFAETPKGK